MVATARLLEAAKRVLAESGRPLSVRKILAIGQREGVFAGGDADLDALRAALEVAGDGAAVVEVRRGVYALAEAGGDEAAGPDEEPFEELEADRFDEEEIEEEEEGGRRRRRRRRAADLVGAEPAAPLTVEEAVAAATQMPNREGLRARLWERMRTSAEAVLQGEPEAPGAPKESAATEPGPARPAKARAPERAAPAKAAPAVPVAPGPAVVSERPGPAEPAQRPAEAAAAPDARGLLKSRLRDRLHGRAAVPAPEPAEARPEAARPEAREQAPRAGTRPEGPAPVERTERPQARREERPQQAPPRPEARREERPQQAPPRPEARREERPQPAPPRPEARREERPQPAPARPEAAAPTPERPAASLVRERLRARLTDRGEEAPSPAEAVQAAAAAATEQPYRERRQAAAPAPEPERRGPVLPEIAPTDVLVAAATAVLRQSGRPMPVEALARAVDATGRSEAKGLRGALLAENARRAAAGLRAPFVLSYDGAVGLSQGVLSERYLQLEQAIEAAVAEQREIVRRDLLARVAELGDSAFEQVIVMLLEQLGYTGVRVVHRAPGGNLALVGVDERGGVSATTAVVARRAWTPIGRDTVRALRGSLHQFGASRGLLLTVGHFGAEAREEATLADRPTLTLVDGAGFARLLYDQGIGLVTLRPVLRYVDAAFFESLG